MAEREYYAIAVSHTHDEMSIVVCTTGNVFVLVFSSRDFVLTYVARILYGVVWMKGGYLLFIGAEVWIHGTIDKEIFAQFDESKLNSGTPQIVVFFAENNVPSIMQAIEKVLGLPWLMVRLNEDLS